MEKVPPPQRIDDSREQLVELVLDAIENRRERKKIARYLSRAEGLLAGGYWTDPVTGNPAHRIPQVFMTDGFWVWSSPWAYLVVKYGAALPAEFLEHIRALGYRPPSLSEERAREIGIAAGLIPSAEVFAEAARIQAEYNMMSPEQRAEYKARRFAEQEASRAEEQAAQSD
jgi:hypothetical protein